MPVQNFIFDVVLDEPDADGNLVEVEHRVRIRGNDRLVAELEAARLKLPSPKVAPQHLTVLWVWCAAKRLGVFTGSFDDFKDALVGLDQAGGEDVDPTQPESTLSGSPAQPTSEIPGSGSTPTSPSGS